MTEKELNAQIDRFIKLFENDRQVNGKVFLTPEYRDISQHEVIRKMLALDLIVTVKDFGSNHTWELTELGYKALEYGGWSKYRVAIISKEINDAKISEYLLRTKWVPHILSGAALLISILSLLVSLQQCRQDAVQTSRKFQNSVSRANVCLVNSY